MAKRKYKHEFTVDRKKWSEGGLTEGEGPGTMCVLGFLGKSLGIPKKDLHGHGSLAGVASTHKKYAKKLGDLGLIKCNEGNIESSIKASMAININDEGIREDNTEERLKKLFDKLAIKVNFINKFPKVQNMYDQD